jgi:hypothetical protein
VIWQKGFSPSGASYARELLETSDGSLIIVGQTDSGTSGGSDALVIKMTQEGEVTWCNVYGGSKWDDASAVVESADGYIVVGGTEGSYSSVDWDAWAFKIDTSGSLVWQTKIDGSYPDEFNDIVATDDGNFLLAGTTTNAVGGSNVDLLIVKMSPGGSVLWQKVTAGGGAEGAYQLIKLADGNFLVGGYTNQYGGGGYDFWAMKMDANCNVLWQRAYGIAGSDWLMNARELPDGKLVFSGIYAGGNQDGFILVTDADGLFDGTRPSFCCDSGYSLQPNNYPVYQTTCVAKTWAMSLLDFSTAPADVNLTVTFLY